jgi:hypothetical protein
MEGFSRPIRSTGSMAPEIDSVASGHECEMLAIQRLGQLIGVSRVIS